MRVLANFPVLEKGIPIIPRPFSRSRALLAALFFAIAAPGAFAALIADPAMVPPGDTGWVGSTSFYFSNGGGLLSGRIMYTLDGTKPQTTEKGSTYRYQAGTSIPLTATTTVRAIQVLGGSVSDEVSHDFVRAKVPTPVARYGGNAHFYPSVPCSLSVGATKYPASIRYTTNDAAPGPSSQLYSAPFTVNKTLNLRAYATASGYDDSDPLKVAFVLDSVSAPALDPAPGPFQTSTLTLHMKSATSGAHIRYTLDTSLASPEKWTLMTGDSVTFQGGKDGDSIMLRAQAFVSTYQTSAIRTAKYTYLPVVAAPAFNPTPPKTFFDTLWVKMTTTTDKATVRYTSDGSTPSATSPDGSAPVLLAKSDTLKARAFKDKHDPSAVTTAAYIMQLSPPTSDKPDGDFTGTLVIHLRKVNPNAVILYSLDGTPSAQNGSTTVQYDSTQGIALSMDGINVVRAIAVTAGTSSQVATFTYTKKQIITNYSAPSVDPASKEFTDTVSIRLSTTEADAEVRYTLTAAGREPLQSDSLAVPGKAILLDSSAVLRCRAFAKPGVSPALLPSAVSEARYTLKPSAPVALPAPGDPVPAGTTVILRSRRKGGIVHYSNDPTTDLTSNQGYPDSVAVTLNASTNLYALVAMGSAANRSYSDILPLHYDVFTSAPSDTLAVGGTRPISGGFLYQNQSKQPVIAKVRTADGLGLAGFSDMSLVVSLQALDPGQALKVAFTKPAGGRVSLYRFAGGQVEYMGGKDSATLTLPGDYFTAVDIQPPAIALLKQVPKEGDSTTVRLRITDNVANPTCEIASPGLKNGTTTRKPDTAGIVSVNLKGGSGDPKPLWLRVVSRDAYDSSALPALPGVKIYVTQLWSKVTTPQVLTIGQGQEQELWDLTGLPVAAGTGMKWAQLRGANPDLQACVWRDGAYASLDDSADIRQGMAFWVGSHARHSSLTVPNLRAGESGPDGTYQLHLQPGWNLVTSPSLDRVYWPITPAVSQAGTTALKAPYRYARDLPGKWQQTDTLEPWIGYFIHYYGDLDTLITVYSSPGSRPAAKAAAGLPMEGAIGLTFSAEGVLPLRLGARAEAQDAAGPEDEPSPPAWGKGFAAWSQRGAGKLITDLIRFRPGATAEWRMIVEPGSAEIRNLKLTEALLPPGYEAWALSRTRGVKTRLGPDAPLPIPESGPDTLAIYAGTQAGLAAIGEWARTPESIGALAFDVEKGRGQAFLRLSLPWNAKAGAEVYTLSGRRVAEILPRSLASGTYRLRLFSGTPAQILILRLRIVGPSSAQTYSRTFLP